MRLGTGIVVLFAIVLVASAVKAWAKPPTPWRHATASYFGPGLYGNTMACGGTLTRSTLGVAHRTLPCGYPVHLGYRGRSIATRVVDRGPYVAGREFDLTSATRIRLDFPNGVATIRWRRGHCRHGVTWKNGAPRCQRR